MSDMSFIRAMTKAQLLKLYQIPTCLEEEFFEGAPVFRHVGGTPYYWEHQVDDYIRTRYPSGLPRGRAGRKVETEPAAVYALSQRPHKIWKRIAADCKTMFPECYGAHEEASLQQIVARHRKRLRKN